MAEKYSLKKRSDACHSKSQNAFATTSTFRRFRNFAEMIFSRVLVLKITAQKLKSFRQGFPEKGLSCLCKT